jgi:branched-chain amino acid transport system substrate-binding protein
MDTASGAAQFFPGGRLKFDKNGRRVGAPLIVVQWQKGEPVTVGPEEFALADPVWTKK